MDYHKKLKSFFKEKGISNKQLSQRLGYSEVMTGRYLNSNKPNYEFIMALIREFPEIDLNYLFKDFEIEVSEEKDTIQTKNEATLIDEIEMRLGFLKSKMAQNCHN